MLKARSSLRSRSNSSSCPTHCEYFGFLIFSQFACSAKYGSELRFATKIVLAGEPENPFAVSVDMIAI